jgi:hypothetical protein
MQQNNEKKKQSFDNVNNEVNEKKHTPEIKKSKINKKIISKKRKEGRKEKKFNIQEEIKKILVREEIKNKKIFRKKEVKIKKSFRKKKPLVKDSYLWWLLFGSVFIVVGIILFKHPETVKQLKKPSPQQLQTIQNEEQFLRIKDALLTNTELNDKTKGVDHSQIKFFNRTPQRTVSLMNNKYLAILKRGKIFIVNSVTNKYTSKLEISPIPKQEKEAVFYNNIFNQGDILLVSGYRQATSSLEIVSFKITPGGILTRGETYDIPSKNYINNSILLGDKLFIYTTRKLLTTTFDDTSVINSWDKKTNKFITNNVNRSKIFFNNNNLAEAPLLHTFTICRLREKSLIDCRQKHLMDDEINSGYINNKNIYFWITQELLKDNPQRIVPNSRLYNLSLLDDSLEMVQVEGSPLNDTALKVEKNEIKTPIYQNNNLPAVWHQRFTNRKMALSKFPLDSFKKNGNLLIDKDEYVLLADNFENDDNIHFINFDKNVAKINLKTAKITILYENGQKKDIFLDENILLIKKILDTNNLFLLSEKNNTISAKVLDTKNITMTKPLVLMENIKNKETVLGDELNSFNSNDNLLISIPVINNINSGNVFLLSLKNDNLEKIYTLPFKKTYQSLRDNCQNDCQQDWKNLVNFFPTANSQKIYALTGSYLKLFYWNKLGKLHLTKTVNYTVKPAPPKPKHAAARVPVGAKVVNGKYVCKKKHDYVGKSKSNNKGYLHLDMECCLDPDEYPNPWCTYRPGELGVTKLHFADYHGKVKRKKK